MTPYAMVPQMLPTAEDLLRGFIPAPAPTPGSLAGPPGGRSIASEMTFPDRSPSGWETLQAMGAGMMTMPTLGWAPPPSYDVQSVPSLSGAETLPTPVASADLGAAAAADPAGAMIGGTVGLGPAFRLLGAAGSGVMSIPGVRAGVEGLGRTLARPAVGVPLALGGSLAASTGEAQAPTALGPRTSEAQTALEAARQRLTGLETERRRLQGLADRFDPDRFDWTSGTQQEREARIKAAQAAIGSTQDGVDGPRTRAALAAYRARMLAQVSALDPRETTARTDIKTAEDRRAEAERLDLADTGRRALEESQPSDLERLLPTAGAYIGGGVGGHLLRNWLARGTTQRAAAQKASVDTASAQLGQGDIPTRVGTLNELWTQGHPRTPFNRGTAPPFAMVPSGSPSLHTPSPIAPWSSVTHEVSPGMMGGQMTRTVTPPDQLYRPSLGTLYGPTAATMGVGGAESAAAQYLMLPGAQQALQEAQAAMDRTGPTPENVAALRSAQQAVAWWTGMQNLGRGMAMGAGTAELTHPLRSLPRPSMAAAEKERGALDMLLHPRSPVAPPTPTPPVPPPAPLPLAHSSNFQPRNGNRFAPGRPVYPPGDPRRGR